MGEKLESLFTQAYAKGGVALAAKLAFRTRMTTEIAGALPDDPEKLARVARALAELIQSAEGVETAKEVTATTRTPPRSTNGLVKRYFDLAKEHGGLLLVIRLAMKTGITSESAASTSDTPEAVEKTRKALEELLPGVNLPGA